MKEYGRGLRDGLKGSEENRPFGGRKDDGGKIRYELLAPDFLRAVATILTFGASKYKDWNWAEGFEWSRLYGATQRHLNAWWDGEAKDPETGHSHLWHAGCCIMFLIVHEIRGLGKDDRHVWKSRDVELQRCTWVMGTGQRCVFRQEHNGDHRFDNLLCSRSFDGSLCIKPDGHGNKHQILGGREFD